MPLSCGAGEDPWKSLGQQGDQTWILRKINTEYSLEGLMLKLKLRYFGHLIQELTHWKSPSSGKDSGQKEKRVSEDEMAGWHHRCNEYELGKISGDGERQGSLVCCSPWGCKESDMTGWLNNNNIHAGIPVLPFITQLTLEGNSYFSIDFYRDSLSSI